MIFYSQKKKKLFIPLERLEKERLSLNKTHGLTQFEKWADASSRKEQTPTWPKSLVGLVVKENLQDQSFRLCRRV